MQAVNRTAEVAVNARSEVRESYSAYRTAYDLAKHYRDEVVPLRKRISEENLLRYNGMLISVFELLPTAREQVAGVTGYVQALRDFWVADTNLQTALTGRSPGCQPHAPSPRPQLAQRRPRALRKNIMSNRRNFFKAAGAVALGATAVSRVGAASLPEAVIQSSAAMQPPLVPSTGRPLQPRRHPERLVASLAHEQRRQGVPPGRRARACASSRPG